MTQICTGFNPCQYISCQTTQKQRGMWEERSPQKAEAVWHLRPGLHLHLCDNKDAWGRGYTLNCKEICVELARFCVCYMTCMTVEILNNNPECLF